jgi:hypothetical protein
LVIEFGGQVLALPYGEARRRDRKELIERALKLTRFRGHPNTCVQGAHDGEDKTTPHTGIPRPDGRAGTRRPLARGPFPETMMSAVPTEWFLKGRGNARNLPKIVFDEYIRC